MKERCFKKFKLSSKLALAVNDPTTPTMPGFKLLDNFASESYPGACALFTSMLEQIDCVTACTAFYYYMSIINTYKMPLTPCYSHHTPLKKHFFLSQLLNAAVAKPLIYFAKGFLHAFGPGPPLCSQCSGPPSVSRAPMAGTIFFCAQRLFWTLKHG